VRRLAPHRATGWPVGRDPRHRRRARDGRRVGQARLAPVLSNATGRPGATRQGKGRSAYRSRKRSILGAAISRSHHLQPRECERMRHARGCEPSARMRESATALRAFPVLLQHGRKKRSLITESENERGADRPSKGGTLFSDLRKRLSIRKADEAFARETALPVQAQHQCSAAQQRGSPWLSDGERFQARARALGAQARPPRSSGEAGRGRHAWSSAPPATVGSSGDLAERCDGSSHRASVAGDALHKCPGQHVIAAAGGRRKGCREAAPHCATSTEKGGTNRGRYLSPRISRPRASMSFPPSGNHDTHPVGTMHRSCTCQRRS
jgi:hypothetical protein